MSDPYQLSTIIDKFQKEDKEFAWKWIDTPSKFREEAVLTDTDGLRKIMHQIGVTMFKVAARPENVVALLGGWAVFGCGAFKPKNCHGVKNMTVNSANGAFIVYDTDCGCNDDMMFLKVAQDASDYLEVETLAMLAVKKNVPAELKKYFVNYKTAMNVICEMSPDKKSALVNFGKYFNGEHDKNYFGAYAVNTPYMSVLPGVITNAVPSGLALGTIVDAWRRPVGVGRPLDKKLSESMRVFHRSGVFDRSVGVTHLDPRVIKTVKGDIMRRVEDFMTGVIRSLAPLGMSHGDLHVGNVLYDAFNDNFVMIDLGRSFFDMDKAGGIDSDVVLGECERVNSLGKAEYKQFKKALEKNGAKNTFYRFFDNCNVRPWDTDRYGVCMDLAGLAFSLHYDLRDRLKWPSGDAVYVDDRDDTIVFASPATLAALLQKKPANGVYEMMMIYFAIMICGLNAAGMLSGVLPARNRPGYFRVPFDNVINFDRAPFYVSFQPMAPWFEMCKDEMANVLESTQFYEYLEKYFLNVSKGGQGKVMFDRKSSKKTSLSSRKELSEKRKRMVRTLTKYNYDYNAIHYAKNSVTGAYKCKDKCSSAEMYGVADANGRKRSPSRNEKVVELGPGRQAATLKLFAKERLGVTQLSPAHRDLLQPAKMEKPSEPSYETGVTTSVYPALNTKINSNANANKNRANNSPQQQNIASN